MSIEIKPAVLEMSEKIQAAAEKLDPKTGAIPTSPELYASLLPEGLTMEMAQAFQDHHSILFPAAMHATGVLSIPAMAEHKDLNKTTMVIAAAGKDRISVNFDRERTYPDQQTKGTLTKPCQVNIGYDIYGTKNRGEVSKVKAFLTQAAHDALVDK